MTKLNGTQFKIFTFFKLTQFYNISETFPSVFFPHNNNNLSLHPLFLTCVGRL